MPDLNFDISEIVRAFSKGQIPERNDLVKYFSKQIIHNRAMIELHAEICVEIMEHGNGRPADAIANAMMYGLVLGVLFEKHSKRVRLI